MAAEPSYSSPEAALAEATHGNIPTMSNTGHSDALGSEAGHVGTGAGAGGGGYYTAPEQPERDVTDQRGLYDDRGARTDPFNPNNGDRRGVLTPPRVQPSADGHLAPGPYATSREGQQRRGSQMDWIVPVETKEKPGHSSGYSVEERIRPTIEHAKVEREKFSRKAFISGNLLNAAIAVQILLSALTTGLPTVIELEKIRTMTAVLGGLSTLVSSYLAKVRGSNEPELSIRRTRDLDAFIREAEIFVLDKGHVLGQEEDEAVSGLRSKFEELLGNLTAGSQNTDPGQTV